jgi:hypothetical protein
MIENEYCTVLVTALYEGGAEQGESNVVREEEDGLSTQPTLASFVRSGTRARSSSHQGKWQRPSSESDHVPDR